MELIDRIRRRGAAGKEALVGAIGTVGSGNLNGPLADDTRSELRRLSGLGASVDLYEISGRDIYGQLEGAVFSNYTVTIGPFPEKGFASTHRSLGKVALLIQKQGRIEALGPIECLGVKAVTGESSSVSLRAEGAAPGDRLWAAIEWRDRSTLKYQVDLEVGVDMEAGEGELMIAGKASNLRASGLLTAETGAQAVSLQEAAITADRLLSAETGPLNLESQAATVGRLLVTEVDNLSVAGQDATVAYTPVGAIADYFVITYGFSDGQDLDTRTYVTYPTLTTKIGWCKGSLIGSPAYLRWGGDNVGTGVESVLFDRANYLLNYPGEETITLAFDAFWYNTAGVNPVVVSVTSYVGGSMVPGGYSWSNPTATATYTSFTSTQKVVTTNLSSCIEGERVTLMTLNFVQGTVVYS